MRFSQRAPSYRVDLTNTRARSTRVIWLWAARATKIDTLDSALLVVTPQTTRAAVSSVIATRANPAASLRPLKAISERFS